MINKIFISYRREESRYQAREIYKALSNSRRKEQIFMDVDSLPLGTPFLNEIRSWVQQCDVLLALVGPGWAKVVDPKTGLRRLENPNDFVRVEIGEALKRAIPVVPVLLDDASVPEPDELPDELHDLFERNAEFISFRTFDTDVNRLIKKLTESESAKQLEQPPAGTTLQSEIRTEAQRPDVQKHFVLKWLDNKKMVIVVVAVLAVASVTLTFWYSHGPSVKKIPSESSCETIPFWDTSTSPPTVKKTTVCK